MYSTTLLSWHKIQYKLEVVIEKCFKKPLFLKIDIFEKEEIFYKQKCCLQNFLYRKDQHWTNIPNGEN